MNVAKEEWLKKLFLFYLAQSKSENCLLTSKDVEIEKKDEEKDFYFLKEVLQMECLHNSWHKTKSGKIHIMKKGNPCLDNLYNHIH